MEPTKKVFSAINRVQSALYECGISKDRKNAQQNYAFRGIDDIFNALSRLLAQNHLVILPSYSDRNVTERETKSGSQLFYVTLKGEFTLVSAEDGSSTTVSTYGEAMDSADKATNKAMSAALKYACLQAFCIPTEGDNDADSITHEVAAKSPKKGIETHVNATPAPGITPEQLSELAAASLETDKNLKIGAALKKAGIDSIEKFTQEQAAKTINWINK